MERCIPEGARLGRFDGPNGTFIGLVHDDSVEETESKDLHDVLRRGCQGTGESHQLSGLRVLSPVDRPSKMICIGLNYRSHIKEMGWKTPEVPIIFTKPPSAIIGPGDDIVLPRASSRVDFEGESAIIISRRAKDVTDGGAYILGYTCMNDVTARDLQKDDPDWTRAKGFDTFAPIGPYIVGSPPSRVETRLNGKVVQSSPLSDRVFGDSALVEYISTVMTLEPGDVIATGTPSGISPMTPGDVVEVELDGVGCLRNKVVGPRPG